MSSNNTLNSVEDVFHDVVTDIDLNNPVHNTQTWNSRNLGVRGDRVIDANREPDEDAEGYGQIRWIYEDPTSIYGGGRAGPDNSACTSASNGPTANANPTRTALVDGAGAPDHNADPIQALGEEPRIGTGEGIANRTSATACADTQIGRRPNWKKSSAALRIASLNIRGGGVITGQNSKWAKISNLMKTKCINYLGIQETHLTQEKVEQLRRTYKTFEIICSPDPVNPGGRGGVAILINKRNTQWKEIETEIVEEGRAIAITIKWENEKQLRLMNVYAPSGDDTDNARFWGDIAEKWRTRQLRRVDVLMGDMNMVEDGGHG
ncbi:hypothetical protein NMY22_g8738 [Coprinellus aureogranulatus]|nr:hypothetical protein NMY22_g8738 [Coprinellus aureogranulatus]